MLKYAYFPQTYSMFNTCMYEITMVLVSEYSSAFIADFLFLYEECFARH